MEQSQSTSNFVVWHRKHGPMLKTPIEHFSARPQDVSMVLVGQFIDNRDFSVRQVQEWVDSWFTRDRISVKKENNLFFFYCREQQDRTDILGLYDTMNFKGAMLIIKAWKPLDSFKSFNFSEAALWIKIEGLPIVISSKSLANLIYSRIGKVLYYDEASGQPGFKKYFRALVWIKVKSPLIPGMYLEMQEEVSWEKAKKSIEKAISKASIPDSPVMFGSPNASLYSNKILGLPPSPEFLTTIVKLDEPRRAPMVFSSSSSSDNDSGGGDDNHPIDEEMHNVSSGNGSPRGHEESNASGRSGPSMRPIAPGSRQSQFSHHATLCEAQDVGSNSTQYHNSRKAKGKFVIPVTPHSFKRNRKKNAGKHFSAFNALLPTGVMGSKSAAGGFSEHKFNLSPRFNSFLGRNEELNSFYLAKPHQIGSFLPLNINTINASSLSLSSSKNLNTLSSHENTQVNMESNHSSPHSSNSITQPSHSHLNIHHSQPTEEVNTAQFNNSVPFETLPDLFPHENNFNYVNINDVGNSGDNLIAPNSLSSYFNSDDALYAGNFYADPYSLSDSINWGELQALLQESSSVHSPQTPLLLPGSHTSLQTGSSSSFHSAVAGLPSAEFADLRIFPCWPNSQPPEMESVAEGVFESRKRKFDELSEVLDAATAKQERLVDVPIQQHAVLSEVGTETDKVIFRAGNQEVSDTAALASKNQIIPGDSSQDMNKVSSTEPKVEQYSPSVIKSNVKPEIENNLIVSGKPEMEPPRRGSGRPPKPKRAVVQALRATGAGAAPRSGQQYWGYLLDLRRPPKEQCE
ncbi:hypothetical protein BVRB_6g136170 [Beta vulgaris subsp. vulgaris]|nr:hypothetical protein BVRB_6g136170 [Beta vulgaris subsp. vulgaris]